MYHLTTFFIRLYAFSSTAALNRFNTITQHETERPLYLKFITALLCVRVLLGQKVSVEVVIGQFVQERSWFQDEGGQDDFGQVHAGPDLLQ